MSRFASVLTCDQQQQLHVSTSGTIPGVDFIEQQMDSRVELWLMPLTMLRSTSATSKPCHLMGAVVFTARNRHNKVLTQPSEYSGSMSNVKEEPNSSPTNGGGLQGGKGDEEEESHDSSNSEGEDTQERAHPLPKSESGYDVNQFLDLHSNRSTPQQPPFEIPKIEHEYEQRGQAEQPSSTRSNNGSSQQPLRQNPIAFQTNILSHPNLSCTGEEGLSRPAVSPGDANLIIVGTEDQSETRNNLLLLVTLQESEKQFQLTSLVELPHHVRDVMWLSNTHMLAACGHKLVVAHIDPYSLQFTGPPTIIPPFHKDLIRETASNPKNIGLVASCGYDGSVYITDIDQVMEALDKRQTDCNNNVYHIPGEIIGSVSWNPQDNVMLSCTTDSGSFHYFDIRQETPGIKYDSLKRDLYCHAFVDPNTVLFGYGDGTLRIFDIRNKMIMLDFHDPVQKKIGEIRVNYRTRCFANFGTPDVSMWPYTEQTVLFSTFARLTDSPTVEYYKTSGCFRHSTHSLIITDSMGVMGFMNF
ncbi:G-protein beta WD-40 repeat domain-containing protein [Planoprotostelium fungivorum]|uniref:G-protein beta WD-40 repeat domain-containing protein n=1 Tax=Planoprotostelium fungivorum TaxID=1890364 RepID=A0A2P6NDC1_9EUKA|nr:G-protein beta WD-40 repeat domain-containing protein [Planoprotostelium fungivorum]